MACFHLFIFFLVSFEMGFHGAPGWPRTLNLPTSTSQILITGASQHAWLQMDASLFPSSSNVFSVSFYFYLGLVLFELRTSWVLGHHSVTELCLKPVSLGILLKIGIEFFPNCLSESFEKIWCFPTNLPMLWMRSVELSLCVCKCFCVSAGACVPWGGCGGLGIHPHPLSCLGWGHLCF